MTKQEEERAIILLKATKEILQKQEDSSIVLDILEQTAIWDGVECDGYCLLEEIGYLLETIEVK